MTEEEKRVKCAEAQGWQNVRKTTVLKGRIMKQGIWGCSQSWSDGGYTKNELIPDFTRDINAAVTLCEWMAEKGWRWEASSGADKRIRFVFIREGIETRPIFSPSLATAITDAFLLANKLAEL